MIAALQAQNPIGYWQLNEAGAAGTYTQDLTGYNRDGQISDFTSGNSILQGAVGPDGNYLDCGNNSNGTFVNFTDQAAWTIPAAGMSWFILIKPDDLVPATQWIWTKGHAPGYEWGISIGSTGTLGMSLWTSGGANISGRAGPAGEIVAGVWNAIVVSVPVPTAACNIKLAVNSNPITNSAGSTTGSGASNTTAPMYIGMRGDFPAGTYFRGGVAHAALYDKQLSDADITTIMTLADADGWF